MNLGKHEIIIAIIAAVNLIMVLGFILMPIWPYVNAMEKYDNKSMELTDDKLTPGYKISWLSSASSLIHQNDKFFALITEAARLEQKNADGTANRTKRSTYHGTYRDLKTKDYPQISYQICEILLLLFISIGIFLIQIISTTVRNSTCLGKISTINLLLAIFWCYALYQQCQLYEVVTHKHAQYFSHTAVDKLYPTSSYNIRSLFSHLIGFFMICTGTLQIFLLFKLKVINEEASDHLVLSFNTPTKNELLIFAGFMTLTYVLFFLFTQGNYWALFANRQRSPANTTSALYSNKRKRRSADQGNQTKMPDNLDSGRPVDSMNPTQAVEDLLLLEMDIKVLSFLFVIVYILSFVRSLSASKPLLTRINFITIVILYIHFGVNYIYNVLCWNVLLSGYSDDDIKNLNSQMMERERLKEFYMDQYLREVNSGYYEARRRGNIGYTCLTALVYLLLYIPLTIKVYKRMESEEVGSQNNKKRQAIL